MFNSTFVMLQEDIKTLCSHVVENYSKIFDEVDYVQTFKALKIRYHQHQDKKDREKAALDRCVSILVQTEQCVLLHELFGK